MNLYDGKTALWHGIFFLAVLSGAAAQGPNYPSYSNPNFKPSMTVTIIVLSVACFFIALFSFYIRRCSRDVHISRGGISLSRTRPAPPGLDASVIETFPTFLYSAVKGLKIGKEVLECAVCLNEFEDEETLRLLPKCNHVFHPECIDAWLSSHTTCPVCRADLIPDSSTPVTLPTEADTSATENTDELPPVVINISGSDDAKPDVINPADQVRFPIKNGSIRSKSVRKGKGITGRFPRSHSTGHSLVQPGDNHERFTLRLPEEVRKQILTGKLNRSTSCISFPTEETVSGGWRSGSLRRSIGRRLESVAKSERWKFLTGTPFFWRNNSAARSTKNGEVGGSVSFKSDGAGQSSLTRPPV